MYVSRDEASDLINGAYANKQDGFGEEWLEDDDPELVAFLNAPPPEPPPTPEEQVLFDHENRLRSMEGQPPLTLGEFQAQKASL